MTIRQRESARHYLDMTAVSASLDATLRMAARTLGFHCAALHVYDDDNVYLLAATGFAVRPDAVVRLSGSVDTDELSVPIVGREGLSIAVLTLTRPVTPCAPAAHPEQLQEFAALLGDLLDVQRGRLRTPVAPVAGMPAAIFATETPVAVGRIVPYYQPIVNLTTGAVCAYEALARWEHPVFGTIAPSEFVPTAEQSEIVIDLDLAVLARASADMARWRARDGALRLNANLSAQHLAHADCVDQILETVAVGGLSPHHVTLEITEATALGLDRRSIGFVEQLRDAGFSIWLDDLGTGWSSLERLIRLPVDGLKVDRSISSGIDTVVGEAVVRAVADIAHCANIASTVEGIETAAGCESARSAGIGFGQGYFWSTPKPALEIDTATAAVATLALIDAAVAVERADGIIAELLGSTLERARELLAERAASVQLAPSDYAARVISDNTERESYPALLQRDR